MKARSLYSEGRAVVPGIVREVVGVDEEPAAEAAAGAGASSPVSSGWEKSHSTARSALLPYRAVSIA